MKKMICCIAMFLFSLLAACAYADVTAGNIIPFGSWHQESAALDSSPVLWRVLEIRGDRALLDPARYSVWMSCGRVPYTIGSTEEVLYNACTAVRDDASGMIELGEIAAFDLRAEDSVPCIYGNPENPLFPVRAR